MAELSKDAADAAFRETIPWVPKLTIANAYHRGIISEEERQEVRLGDAKKYHLKFTQRKQVPTAASCVPGLRRDTNNYDA